MRALIVFAHPYPDRSLANRILVNAVASMPQVDIRSLYDLYPDFNIDAAAERDALDGASIVVWQHPIFWYSVPSLLKLWFEKVLTPGWAWGPGGNALHGKRCLWVVTTGGSEADYGGGGMHRHRLVEFGLPIRQTAEFCGMLWLPPIIVPEARQLNVGTLEDWGKRYRRSLQALIAGEPISG